MLHVISGVTANIACLGKIQHFVARWKHCCGAARGGGGRDGRGEGGGYDDSGNNQRRASDNKMSYRARARSADLRFDL